MKIIFYYDSYVNIHWGLSSFLQSLIPNQEVLTSFPHYRLQKSHNTSWNKLLLLKLEKLTDYLSGVSVSYCVGNKTWAESWKYHLPLLCLIPRPQLILTLMCLFLLSSRCTWRGICEQSLLSVQISVTLNSEIADKMLLLGVFQCCCDSYTMRTLDTVEFVSFNPFEFLWFQKGLFSSPCSPEPVVNSHPVCSGLPI